MILILFGLSRLYVGTNDNIWPELELEGHVFAVKIVQWTEHFNNLFFFYLVDRLVIIKGPIPLPDNH